MKFIYSLTICVLISLSTYSQMNLDSSDYYFQTGKVQFDEGRFTDAIISFKRALNFNPGNLIEVLEATGRTEMKLSKQLNAKMYFMEAYAVDSTNKAILADLMKWYFNNRRYDTAISFAQKCACKGSNGIIGSSAFYLENYGLALQYLTKAVKEESPDGSLSYRLARTLIELGKTKEALPYFQKAADNNPDSWTYNYELATILYNLEDYKNSLKYMVKLENMNHQKNLNFYENLSFISIYAGDEEKANAAIARVLISKPNNVDLISDLAYAWFETKNFKESGKLFEKVFELKPKDASALYMQGLSVEKLGDIKAGRELSNKAIKMDPKLRNLIKVNM